MADKSKIEEPVKAPDMADLLEYFETRSRALDKEGQPMLDPSTLQFMSLIKFNGVSILPPVLNEGRREEMLSYKHEALRREKTSRVKKTEELHAKVQSIVAGVEERRAAKQASKSLKTSVSSSRKSSSDRPATAETVSKVTTKSTSKSGVSVPSEIAISVTGSSKDVTSSPSRNSSKASPKSISSGSTKSSVSPSRSASHSSSDSKKKDHTNYKSLSKLGALSKQKSFSSQHLDKSGIQPDSSVSMSKNTLLPHPPVGRPPSRGSMRQSSSTPDLRTIDMAVKTEELKKPIKSGRSLSPKGGRPQASEPENVKEPKERPESRTGKPRDKETIKQNKMRENKTKQEIVNKAREDLREQKSRKNETSVKKGSDVRTSGSKSVNKAESDGSMVSRRKPVDQPNTQIHNPLEVLEQELTREDEHERKKRFSGSSQGSTGEVRPKVFEEVRQELDPIQTATAELFPFPISEEQAMATLDSLQPDFASLEQQDSLPKDYNGIPLTSLKQQQIIHMLTKLSKALNMEDTLSSTTSTAMPGEHVKQEYLRGPTSRSEGDYRNIQYGASGGKGSMYGEYAEGNDLADELSVNITADSATTGSSYQNSSNTSAHSRARMSPTGSSILSSASSVSGSRQRMSPKSLKNTVHFSTLVTEISTSASQSYEDKISYRKLDITPKNSENFEDQLDVSNQSRNLGGEEVTPVSSYSVSASGSNLLSKVALSPSVDTSAGSPGEFSNHNPFDNSNQESDLNTSDKENEYVPVDHDSSDENFDMNVRSGRNQPVLNVYMANMPAGPIGENHPAVVHVKSKSEMSDSSVLKESSEKVLQENVSRTNLKLDPQSYYGSDLDNLIQGKITPSDSITSMQEEITRSYMLAQNKSEKESNDSEDKFEFKKPKKVVRKQLDVDDSLVILQPVIYTNTGSSLQENRSMLEEEEIIRNNLERVHLEDSESDEDNIEHPIQMADESDNEFDTRSENVNEECIVENEGSNEENNEDEDESDEGSELESDVDEEVSDDDVNDAQPLKVVEEDTDDVKVQEVDDQSNTNQEVEKEEEAKAEHIQRYLNQVHEQSLHHDDNESVHSDDAEPTKSQSFVDVMDNIGALISSFTTNIQTMNHMSQEELFKMQTQQFELIQQKLIEHQRAQLEELFVAQRREQMSLEKEIEEYHKKIVDVESPALSEINMEPVLHRQTDIPATGPMVPGFNSVMNPSPMCSTMNGPINNALPGPVNPLKPRISNSMPQVTQAWQAYPQPIHSSAKSPPFVVQPVASAVPIQNPNMSFNTSYSSMGPYQDPRLNMAMGMDPRSGVGVNYPMGYVPDPNISSISHNTSYSTIPHRDPGMLRGNMNPPPNLDVIRSQDPGSSHASNPFIYPSSPSLYIDPKDRDNASEVSGFAKATPKQLMFSNQSTPVQTVKQHKSYKPLQHSPVKPTSTQRETGQYVIPEKVFDPSMHHKFSKVTAAVRGYLTRRLLQTPKVQEIIKTINDTRNFAFSFQAETPIKKGTYSREDRTLLERIVNQLQAALLDIHEIFFIIPTSERMSIIASARHLQEEKMLRESQRRSMDSVSRSQPKLSKATLKAMERKKKAQLAEESVFGSTELRPKSAPPSTSSPLPSTDISGPLRRHYHSLFVRALRPLQGQISPIVTDRQITVREMKERPKTAPEKRKSGDGSSKTKKSSNSKSSKTSTNSASVKQKSSKEKSQNSVAAKDKTQGTNVASRTKKMDKAWR